MQFKQPYTEIGSRVLVWARLPGKTMAWQSGTVTTTHSVKLDRGPTVGIAAWLPEEMLKENL